MFFIVQILPFVHLFTCTLKLVFRWFDPLNPHQGSALDLLGALSGPQTPRHKLCLHFILYLATPLNAYDMRQIESSEVMAKAHMAFENSSILKILQKPPPHISYTTHYYIPTI
jgi:hypothetical protein